MAEGGNVAAGCELLRRAVVQLNLRDPALSVWVTNFLTAALRQPRRTVKQLIAPRTRDLDHPTPQTRPLSQEVVLRVRAELKAGTPRKKVFSDVAKQLDALGYRNAKNERLRANSIERQYYTARRNANTKKRVP